MGVFTEEVHYEMQWSFAVTVCLVDISISF